jgi:hypothetical protein
MTREWPKDNVDHRDLDKLNDKWNNLRGATTSQNAMNRRVRSDSKTGLKGVRVEKGKFTARVKLDGRTYRVSGLRTVEEAIQAREALAIALHEEFAR